MRPFRFETWGLLLILLSVLATWGLYDRLPDPVPIHWDLRGSPDGFAPKPWGPVLFPAMLVVVYLVLAFLPRFLRGSEKSDEVTRALDVARLGTLGFLFALNLAALIAPLGYPGAMERSLTVGLGGLFMVIGPTLRHLPRNRIIGVRTPSTLRSDEVWKATHERCAHLFSCAGVAILVVALMGGGLLPVLVLALAAGLASLVVAWVEGRRVREESDRK